MAQPIQAYSLTTGGGLPNWLSVGSKVLGSLGLGGGGKSSSYYANRALHQQNLQRDWLKKEMTYRVEGAKAAGIHPLYALGMNPSWQAPMIMGDKKQNNLGAAASVGLSELSRQLDPDRKLKKSMDMQTHDAGLAESQARARLYDAQAASYAAPNQPQNINMFGDTGRGNDTGQLANTDRPEWMEFASLHGLKAGTRIPCRWCKGGYFTVTQNMASGQALEEMLGSMMGGLINIPPLARDLITHHTDYKYKKPRKPQKMKTKNVDYRSDWNKIKATTRDVLNYWGGKR